MRQVVDITQEQVLNLLRPLIEYLTIDVQDVSKITVTAGYLEVQRYGNLTNRLYYKGGQ